MMLDGLPVRPRNILMWGSLPIKEKYVQVYADYKINLLKDGNPSNPNTDTAVLGLVYESLLKLAD